MTVFTELTMRPYDGGAGRGWDAGLRSRLALAMSTTALLLIGANLATPLYPLLQERLALGPFAVTLAFSSYVLALITGLVLYGHWSDHIGRRAALVLAVLTGLAGELLFATAGGLGALVAGRVLQGGSVAMATGAGSAALRELLPERPETASRFTLLASVGGVAAGPLLGGVLAVLPPPTMTTSLPRKKNPSQVAQAETPKPRYASSLGRPSQRAWAPVAMTTVSPT
jgi:MFS family permease